MMLAELEDMGHALDSAWPLVTLGGALAVIWVVLVVWAFWLLLRGKPL